MTSGPQRWQAAPGGAAPARAVAHVFVDDLDNPVLAGEDGHHLARVLRLRPGEMVSASDGRGGLLQCEWVPPSGLRPLGGAQRQAPPQPVITVAVALTKGQRPELAVQKLTEAGVDRVVLLASARCVARWEPGAQPRHIARLRQVARQAAMQSRRCYLPSVEGVLPFSSFAGRPGVALATPDGEPPDLAYPTLLVGPEGGWAEEELASVPAHVGLGPHVLRAETAAIASGVLMAALRAGLVAPAGQGGKEGAGQGLHASRPPGGPSLA